MSRRARGTPLGDVTRRPHALPHVKRKQLAAERKALSSLSDDQRARNLARVAELQALLERER